MDAAGGIEIDIQAASDAPGIPDDRELRRWIRLALDAGGPVRDCEVSVRIVDAPEMQALNREFRGKDRPTNVLAFGGGADTGLPPTAQRMLGDLVICAPVLHDEALAQHKPLPDHWAHIIVHGVLHLLGYDHVEAADATAMEALETRVLGAQGIRDPYSER